MLHEAWRPVVGYEGQYSVSDTGRVRSEPRLVYGGPRAGNRLTRGKIKDAPVGKRGYRVVSVWWSNKMRLVPVHVLVCEAFHGPAPDAKMLVRHLDGDPLNNCADNLRWGDTSGNLYDAVSHGTHGSSSKVTCPRGHRLEEWNVPASARRRGVRWCRSCGSAQSRYRTAIQRGKTPRDIQVMADESYERFKAAHAARLS